MGMMPDFAFLQHRTNIAVANGNEEKFFVTQKNFSWFLVLT